MMKKNILFLLVLLSLFACGGDDGGGGTASGGSEYLNVSNVDITGDKTSATLSIQASPNCEWNISCNDSWVSNIAPSSGRGSRDVTITLSGVNPSSSSSRFATITVRNSSGSITRSVTLTQAANGEYIEIVGDATQSFSNKADNREIAIRSNTHWTVSITGNTEWISVTPTEGDNDGSIKLSISNNSTAETRQAVIIVKGSGNAIKQLNIVQSAAAAPTVTVPQVSDIKKDGAMISFHFDSELPVTTCGVCYATTDNPDIDHHPYVSQTSSMMQGNPQIQLTGLTPNTTYFIRAFAVNAVGIQYSNSNSFTTSSTWPGENDVVTP